MRTGYAERYERFEATLPHGDHAARRAGLERFLADGFPDRRLEAWHYTDLSALNDRVFELAPPPHTPSLDAALPGVDRLVFVDGQLITALSTASWLDRVTGLPAAVTDDPLRSFNAAFATPGVDLSLTAGERLPRPLHLLFVGSGTDRPSMSHQRHRIDLAAGAEAEVFIEHTGTNEAERLSTQRLDIVLGANARLRLVRLQRERTGSTLLAMTTVRIERHARLDAVIVDAGQGLARHDLDITLAAPGAEADLHVLCAPTARAHCDTQTRIVHASARGRSRLGFRGIVADRAKAIFNGRVVVEPGAQKTDSEQRIASLLLSPRAEVNAKPDLEIHADDVKCAHGATVGQLDDAALAYLRSRGIDGDTARALLLRAFAIEAIEPITFQPLRHHVETLLGFAAGDEHLVEAA